MGTVALLLLLTGAFLIYEVARSASASTAAAAAGSAGSGSGGSTTPSAPTTGSSASGGVGGLFPQVFYNALHQSESGGTQYGSGNAVGFFGVSGSGPSGSQSFPSQSPPYVTPPLALYPDYQSAMQGLDQILQQPQYGAAYSRFKATGNICQFVDDIAPMYESGTVAPTALSSQWAANIRSLMGCS